MKNEKTDRVNEIDMRRGRECESDYVKIVARARSSSGDIIVWREGLTSGVVSVWKNKENAIMLTDTCKRSWLMYRFRIKLDNKNYTKYIIYNLIIVIITLRSTDYKRVCVCVCNVYLCIIIGICKCATVCRAKCYTYYYEYDINEQLHMLSYSCTVHVLIKNWQLLYYNIL